MRIPFRQRRVNTSPYKPYCLPCIFLYNFIIKSKVNWKTYFVFIFIKSTSKNITQIKTICEYKLMKLFFSRIYELNYLELHLSKK